jgi:hypothetical protein
MHRRILLLMACMSFGAMAQSLIALQFPYGQPIQTVSGTALSMGGAAAGLPDDFHLLRVNPANLATIDRTIFAGLATVDLLRITDDDRHSNHAMLTPRQLSFSVPVGIVGNLGLSLAKEAEASADFRSGPIDLGEGFDGDLEFKRDGGLTSWLLGWGRQINKRFYLGASYERLYLTVNTVRLRRVLGENSSISRDSTFVSFAGNGLRLGMLVDFDKIGAGFAYEYRFEGDLEFDRRVLRDQGNSQIDEDSSETATLRLPPKFVVGASYEFSPSWIAAADLSLTQWGQYSADGLLQGASRQNAASFAAGVRFIPAPDVLAPRYWETMQYRAGGRYTQLPDRDSDEFALSLGVGLPLSGGGLIDIALEAGRRTDDEFDDYREDFVSIGVGFNGGRSWQQSAESGF